MSLVEHLKQLGAMMKPHPGFQYGSFYAYFAERGTLAQSRVLPQPYMGQWRRDVMRDVRRVNPQMKECFYNAQKLVLENSRRFTYWEGFVLGAACIPIHHGWVVENWTGKHFPGWAPGLLVDPTLRLDHEKGASAKNLVLGEIPEGWEYIGCAFPREKIMARWKTGEAGSLVDDYKAGWPELRGNGAPAAPLFPCPICTRHVSALVSSLVGMICPECAALPDPGVSQPNRSTTT